MDEFDINDALRIYKDDSFSVPTPEADPSLIDCQDDPESLTSTLVNSVLNPVVDAVAENPEAIGRASVFDSIQFLLKCAPTVSPSSASHLPVSVSDFKLFALSRQSAVISPPALSKVLDLIVSGLSVGADTIHHDLEGEEQDSIAQHKKLLEMLGFLLQWAISAVDTKASSEKSSASAARTKGGKGAKSKAGTKEANWEPTSQIQNALDVMAKVLKLKLSKIFVTTSERDVFIGLFTRPVYLLLENEARVKNTAIRMHSFKVLCIAVKHHGHANGKFCKHKSSRLLTEQNRSANLYYPELVLFRALFRTHGRVSEHSG